jgi:putative nucleotidyltransferase with HDIG domain
MDSDCGEKINDYIKKMPSLPTSVTKVLEICNNPQTSAADLNHVISLDPVLIGRVLKLINSAYYGMNQPVTNLVRAIIMLGINTVKNMALSSTMVENLMSKRAPRGLDMEGFWRHSLCVGVAAKLLAKRRGIDRKILEEYFTAGLLHDIGKIPLNAVLSEDYVLTLKAADRGRVSLYREEERSLPRDHCAAGAEIVKAWKLEGPLGDAIVYHHRYGEYQGGHGDVLYSVMAANYFAWLYGIGFAGDCHPDSVDTTVWDALGVSPDVLEEIEPLVNGEIEKAKIFLKL